MGRDSHIHTINGHKNNNYNPKPQAAIASNQHSGTMQLDMIPMKYVVYNICSKLKYAHSKSIN